jgi:hypothetical protein
MLSTEELNTVLLHLTINPNAKKQGNSQTIADYYSAIPASDMTTLMDLMTPLDRHKYFALERFGDWYSAFNLKLHEATAIVTIRATLEEIIEDSANLLNGINRAGLTSQTMQELVTDMFRRQLFDCLFSFLVCLSSDGIFESHTVWLYSIELFPYARYQTMGLSAPPTAQEIQSLL